MRSAIACLLFAVATVVASSPVVSAQDDESISDVLQGFDEDLPEEEVTEAEEIPAARAWELTGSTVLSSAVSYINHKSANGTEFTGLQKLRTRLNLQLDVHLTEAWKLRASGFGFYDFAYRLQGRGKYSHEVIDEYEWDSDLQDTYVQGRLAPFADIKIGRQVVNWGRSETLRVLDMINPLDNREPGLVDIEDLRRPLAMLRLDAYAGDWSVTALAIPEIRFDLLPPFGSDFFPVPTRLGVPPEREPNDFSADTEWALRVAGVFSGWDVSFQTAYYWEDLPHLVPGPATPANPLGAVARHGRQWLIGAGGNYTLGSWLLKGEAAYLGGVDYSLGRTIVQPGIGAVPVPTGTRERSRVDVMAGVEYYGVTDTSMAFEIVERHIDGFDRRMQPFDVRQDAFEASLRISSDFMHARLHTTALGVMFGELAQDGAVVRLSADYELRDAWMVTAGLLVFYNGDPVAVSDIGDNDRLFFETKYSF